MDATEKAKWTEEAAKDKERFSKENAAYMAEKNPTPVVVDETIQPDDNAPETGKETLEKIVAIAETVEQLIEDAVGSVMESRESGIKSKKVATVKEQGGSSGDGSGEIPPQVANYFAFLFSRWAGARQV